MKLWSVRRVDAKLVDFSCGRGGLLEARHTRKLWAVRRVNAVKKQVGLGAGTSSRANVSIGTDT